MRWWRHWQAATPDVILLTATPEQLGAEGHFCTAEVA